ncbi:MAG: GNAT family N-acetyltransferase [Acidimicrobiales bacterium]
MPALPRHVDERPLGPAELREASELAVRAFHDDPFFCFLLPNERTRARALFLVHRSVLTHPGPGARVRSVRDYDDRILGVALWLPTGRYPQPVRTQLAQMPGLLRANFGHLQSMRRGFAYFKASAKAHQRDPHWYLNLLMTEPAEQRRGVGAALMEDGLTQIDAEGVGTSLETQNEENVTYYSRFGYELRSTVHPVAEGPSLFSLWRPPRPRA